MNVNLIIPRLWIGDVRSSEDGEFMRENGINVIVNCTKNFRNVFEPFVIGQLDKEILDKHFIKYYRIGCDDNGREDEVDNFFIGTKEIIENVVSDYKNGKNILVHCAAGQQRSCSFALCLMHRLGFTKDAAFYEIVAKRPCGFNFGREIHFKRAIEEFR